MRYLIMLLLCTSLFSPVVCDASKPLIPIIHNTPGYTLTSSQELDLWVNSPGNWNLKFSSTGALQFQKPGETDSVTDLTWFGTGNGFLTHELYLVVDTSTLGVGKHSLEVEISLEGAQGFLGLFLEDGYWLLPLNTDQMLVKRGNDLLPLARGAWFLLADDDLLYFSDEKINFAHPRNGEKTLKSQGVAENLVWEEQTITGQVGEKVLVSLSLQGPIAAQSLVLTSGQGILFLDPWILEPDGKPLRSKLGDNRIELLLPALTENKIYKIKGSIKLMLPFTNSPGAISAQIVGANALLGVQIDKAWFDQNGARIIRGPTQQVILPDGTMGSVGDGGNAVLHNQDTLDLLIPFQKPWRPLWLGTLTPTTYSLGMSQDKSREFFIPVFLWDQDFSWRVVLGKEEWFVALSPEWWLLQGKAGLLNFSGEKGNISLWGSHSPVHGSQIFHLKHTPTSHILTVRGGKWSTNLDIPREAEKKPTWQFRYGGENWHWVLGTRQNAFSFSQPHWAWGGTLESKTLWLELFQGRLRAELNTGGWNLTYGGAWGRWYLGTNFQADLKLGFKKHNLEWYWQTQSGTWEQGLRLKSGKQVGKWHFATSLALQQHSNLFMGEGECLVGYNVLPNCTVYVKGRVGVNRFERRLVDSNFSHGAGIVFTPLPQFYGELSWERDRGLRTKIGVALPRTKSNTE